MTQRISGEEWSQLDDELKIFPTDDDIQDKMMDPMVSPPLVRSTSTHAQQDQIEEKMFSYDESTKQVEQQTKQSIVKNTKTVSNMSSNRASIQSQKAIFRVSKNRPQSTRNSGQTPPTRSRTRSSSFQRSIDSNSDSQTRRRSGSFDIPNYMNGSSSYRYRNNQKYQYNPQNPGFAFGTAQRRLHSREKDAIPPPGSYMPKVGIGHDKTTSSRFHAKSKRFAYNYRLGSTPKSMGPGSYTIPSTFKTHSFNSKAGRGGTFSKSKRMDYKVDKNIPNAAKYYPKVNNYTKKGSALSKARRFASPETSDAKNKVPVGSYNVPHILNHDRQTAYYPVSNKKIASKIGRK